MTEIKYVIEEGAEIPADVTAVHADGEPWLLQPNGHWHSVPVRCGPFCNSNGAMWLSSLHPLTVTAVREPEALITPKFQRQVGGDTVALDEVEQCWYTAAHVAHRWNDEDEPHYCMGRRPEFTQPVPERTLIGPPHAHLDAPCTDKCYETAPREPEPQQPDASALLDLVRQYGHACYENGCLAEGPERMKAFGDVQTLFGRIAALVPQQIDKTGGHVHRALIELAVLRGLLNRPLLKMEIGETFRTIDRLKALLIADLTDKPLTEVFEDEPGGEPR